MNEYICLDCNKRFTVDITIPSPSPCCPGCGSEDVEELDTYLENEANNDEDDYKEDRRMFEN